MKVPLIGRVLSLVGKSNPAASASRAPSPREERLRHAIERAPFALAITSPDGHWILVNAMFREVIGYSREDLTRITFNSITHPDDAKAEAEAVKRITSGAAESYSIQKRVIEKGGTYRTLNVRAAVSRTKEGEPEFFMFVVDAAGGRRDIVADTKVVDDSMLDLLGEVAVIRTDDRGVIVGWNRGAEQIFGWSAREAIGKSRRMLYRESDSWGGASTRQLQQAASGGQIATDDWRVTKSGTQVWVRTTLTAFAPHGTLEGYLEVITPPAPERLDTKVLVDKLRADLEKARGTETSLREGFDHLRTVGEQTMNELKILTEALRKEIERRKTLEEQLRDVTKQLVAHPDVEEEVVIEAVPEREWSALEEPSEDLLRRIAKAGRSGTLRMVSGESRKEVFFDAGKVFSVSSNDPQRFLAQRLAAEGRITDEQRQRAIEINRETGLAIGRLLLLLGAVTEEQLVAAMQRKVEEELADLVTWREGRWEFIDGPVAMLKLVPLRLDIEEALRPRAAESVAEAAPAESGAGEGTGTREATGTPEPAIAAAAPAASQKKSAEKVAPGAAAAMTSAETREPRQLAAAAASQDAPVKPEPQRAAAMPEPEAGEALEARHAAATSEPQPVAAPEPEVAIAPLADGITSPPPSPSRVAAGEELVASRNARKYHLRSCSKVKKVSKGSRVTFATEAEALARGLEACRHCLGEPAAL